MAIDFDIAPPCPTKPQQLLRRNLKHRMRRSAGREDGGEAEQVFVHEHGAGIWRGRWGHATDGVASLLADETGVCLGERDAGQGGDFFSSTRLAPLVITSTDGAVCSVLKMMLLAICATSHLSSAAASALRLRPGCSSSMIVRGTAVGSEPVLYF